MNQSDPPSERAKAASGLAVFIGATVSSGHAGNRMGVSTMLGALQARLSPVVHRIGQSYPIERHRKHAYATCHARRSFARAFGAWAHRIRHPPDRRRPPWCRTWPSPVRLFPR